MKTTIKLSILLLVFSIFSTPLVAQKKTAKSATITFTVSGNCNMCKATIEEAALIKGVKFAEWNKETKIITVVYNPNKTSEDAIHKAIAASGYDTDKVKADKEAYDALPGCCLYKEGDNTH